MKISINRLINQRQPSSLAFLVITNAASRCSLSPCRSSLGVAALPRTRRDKLKPRIVMLAGRLQSDNRQLQKWHDDHWVDNTLNWRV